MKILSLRDSFFLVGIGKRAYIIFCGYLNGFFASANEERLCILLPKMFRSSNGSEDEEGREELLVMVAWEPMMMMLG